MYYSKETKPPQLREDGSEIFQTGEWEIVHHFNQDVVAKVTFSRVLTDRIVKMLNDEEASHA